MDQWSLYLGGVELQGSQVFLPMITYTDWWVDVPLYSWQYIVGIFVKLVKSQFVNESQINLAYSVSYTSKGILIELVKKIVGWLTRFDLLWNSWKSCLTGTKYSVAMKLG